MEPNDKAFGYVRLPPGFGENCGDDLEISPNTDINDVISYMQNNNVVYKKYPDIRDAISTPKIRYASEKEVKSFRTEMIKRGGIATSVISRHFVTKSTKNEIVVCKIFIPLFASRVFVTCPPSQWNDFARICVTVDVLMLEPVAWSKRGLTEGQFMIPPNVSHFHLTDMSFAKYFSGHIEPEPSPADL